MNPLLDLVFKNGLLLDAAGVLGLGLIGVSAVRLAQRERSWGGTMMVIGAIGLLVARLIILIFPELAEAGSLGLVSTNTLRILKSLTPFLLTVGLAGIVWGLWAHERWLRETTRRD